MFKYLYFKYLNYFCYGNTTENKVYRNMTDDESEHASQESSKSPIDDKQLRIDTLLFIRQFKNTYYKYTNKQKFNPELYNSFTNDENFDGGMTGFDDDDEGQNVRIFDKYILEYIKNRSDVITYLQCKNKDVVIKLSLEQLKDIECEGKTMDILFAIDMPEKDLFNYCYSIIQKNGSISMIKHIVFSMIVRFQKEYIRIRLNALSKNKQSHPYLILERFLS